MNAVDLKSLSIEELWAIHEETTRILSKRMEAEKLKIDTRLDKLGRPGTSYGRRPYAKVHPKFRNPEQPNQTWSGRGLQPHWLTELLAAGRCIDDFRVSGFPNHGQDGQPDGRAAGRHQKRPSQPT
jgi:DNA-binding protein H-NS